MEVEQLKRATVIAADYFGVAAPPKRLGWGVSGAVFLSPDSQYCVKVHHRAEGYATERDVYRRLDRLRITGLHGLQIPRMWDCTDSLRLIRMDYITPPFLLDFAGVLFRPPDFNPDAWQHWQAEIEAAYGPENVWLPHAVYDSLRKHGMYYVDIRVSNINPEGHPQHVPQAKLSWDDL